jgi:hypothetical protein
MQESLIENVVNISFHEGLVRLELGGFSFSETKEGDEPNVEKKQRIIMTPKGFLRVLGSMNALSEKLLDANVLKKTN